MCARVLYRLLLFVFFFKQKTAYEMRISDWSSDVCSSDLKRSRPSAWVAPAASACITGWSGSALSGTVIRDTGAVTRHGLSPTPSRAEIGRASCRERVCQYV